MADIDIQCPECRTIASISEFADVAFVSCKTCGRKLPRPDMNADRNTTPRLKLRDGIGANGLSAPPQPSPLSAVPPARRQRRKKPWRISHHIVAWVLFLGLGAGMWTLRYGGYLPTPYLQTLQEYAPVVILAFHVLIVLKAFQDSLFQGILCLLVPGYSLVYLFFINDDFYGRAVFAGLLVGMAEDSLLYGQDKLGAMYDAITAWLAGGG